MPGSTTRGAFPYPLASEPTNPPGDLQALADRMAAIGALYGIGTIAARPAPAAATAGMWWKDSAVGGRVYFCDGVTWETVDPPNGLDDAWFTGVSAHLADGSAHGSGGIADGAITTPKIADQAVTFAKLALALRDSVFSIGDIKWQVHETAPSAAWVVADGAAKSRTTFAAAYALFGTRFGAGDGVTTFNIPNLVGSVPEGVANNAGTAQKAAGLSHPHNKSGGVQNGNASHNHALTIAGNNFNTGTETADHGHGVNGSTGGETNPGGMAHTHVNTAFGAGQESGLPDHNLTHGHGIAFGTGGRDTVHAHNANHGHAGSTTDTPAVSHPHTDNITVDAASAGSTTKLVPFVKIA